MGRRGALAAIAGVCVLAAVGALASIQQAASTAVPPTISREAAVAAAMRQLPAGGSGFAVVKSELEPNSTHFQFTGAGGSTFGGDGATQCLIIPPLPLPLACRPYPVWVVEVAGPSCHAIIAINGYSGRFGGAGTDGCDIIPEDEPPPWFVPSWE